MNYKSLTKTIYTAITLVTLLSIILLTLSFMLSFDSKNGYFTKGIFPILFNVAFVLGALLSLAVPFLLKKGQVIKSNASIDREKPIYIAFISLLIICVVAFNFFTLSKYFVIAIMGVCFFAFFLLLCVMKGGYAYSHLKIIFLLLTALFPILLTMGNDMQIYRHSNSLENKLAAVFAISFLIYILYEGKRLFTGEHSKWHFASMLLASHTGLSLSVSYLISFALGGVNEETRLYQIIVILAISSFIEYELVRFIKKSESHTKEEWDEIEAPAQNTEE